MDNLVILCSPTLHNAAQRNSSMFLTVLDSIIFDPPFPYGKLFIRHHHPFGNKTYNTSSLVLLLQTTILGGYRAISYRTAACGDLASPNVADCYEPNTTVNEPESATKLLLKEEKDVLVEAEEDA